MKPVLRFCFEGSVVLLLIFILTAPAFCLAFPTVKLLNHCGGGSDEQITWDSKGYAVRYKVPSGSTTWFAMSVEISGEIDGDGYDPNRTMFQIAFMDIEGNVYAESEHAYGDYFGGSPGWASVKITPTELPPEFWVVVNFRPERSKGVYIGYVKNGGGHSKVTDQNLNLFEFEEGWDWCIGVKVKDEIRGKRIEYDPSSFKKKADTKATGSGVKKREATDRVVVEYSGFEDIWAKSISKLVETALLGFEEAYGLKSTSCVKVTAVVDPDSEFAGVRLNDDGTLEWIIRNRNELLPVSRGGKHLHIFGFCRGLAAWLVRGSLVRPQYGPEGQEDGFAAYLGANVLPYIFKACGRNLWPVPYNYHVEEGPRYLKKWMNDEEGSPDRAIAGLLSTLQEKVGEKKFNKALAGVLDSRPAARDVMKKFYEALSSGTDDDAEEQWLDAAFPVELVDPPILWFLDRPDFDAPETFAGMKAKRYKSQIFLQYDDRSCEGAKLLDEEEHAVYFKPPPGKWRIAELKVYCCLKGGNTKGRVAVKLLDEKLVALASVETPYTELASEKPRWQTVRGFPSATVSSPFYLSLDTGSKGGSGIEIGFDEGVEKPHSALIRPGSYIRPVPGKFDWMVRLYLEPSEAMDRDALNEAVKALRKEILR